MATKKTPETIDAFVLVNCQYGKCGEVVTLPAADAQAGADAGSLDLHPDAIKANRKE